MPTDNSIKYLIDNIREKLVESHQIPKNFISLDVNKDDSETVWLVEPVTGKKSKFVLNYSIKGSEKKKYFCFEIPNSLTNIINIPETAEIKRIKSNTIHTFLIFKIWNDNVTTFIEETITYYVEHFEPSEKFGCCHRYKECSNARKCLHPDLFYAKACWYRKNLENGRVFY